MKVNLSKVFTWYKNGYLRQDSGPGEVYLPDRIAQAAIDKGYAEPDKPEEAEEPEGQTEIEVCEVKIEQPEADVEIQEISLETREPKVDYSNKSLKELQAIAKSLGMKNYQRLNKGSLYEKVMEVVRG